MTILHSFVLFVLLILQVLHLFAMIVSLFFVMRYYSCQRIIRSYFKSSLAWGIISEPFAFVLFLISLQYATLGESVFYAISLIVGLIPLILIILHKD